MKLNLGCGTDIKQGYTNVDFRELPGVNVICDLSKFPWQFADESADEILLLDFLEHFPYKDTSKILMQCYRVLVPDGTLVIQVPDATHLTRAISQEGDYLCNRCGDRACHGLQCLKCGQTYDEISHAAMMRLYGGQDYPGNFHQTCFTKEMLELQARAAGFGDTDFSQQADHMWANWSIYGVFKKGDLW